MCNYVYGNGSYENYESKNGRSEYDRKVGGGGEKGYCNDDKDKRTFILLKTTYE
jgi:hypothetical protein